MAPKSPQLRVSVQMMELEQVERAIRRCDHPGALTAIAAIMHEAAEDIRQQIEFWHSDHAFAAGDADSDF